MIAWALAGLTLAGVFLMAALGDLVSEEIRGWLDLVPRAILRLAATQLDAAQRETIYEDEWLPELTYALRGAEARPVTRLITGIRYATGILIAARRVARRLNRTAQPEKTTASGTAPGGRLHPAYEITNTTSNAVTIDSHSGFRLAPGDSLIITSLFRRTIRECDEKGLAHRRVEITEDLMFHTPPQAAQ